MILLFAVATGQAVASNYLAQPLLATIRNELGISTGVAGLIVTTAQVGYAAGLILLLPLGDLLERRRLITGLALITAAGLAAAALTPSIGLLMAAVGVVGFTSVMAQILVPFAATLAPRGGTRPRGRHRHERSARGHPGGPHLQRARRRVRRLAHGLRPGRRADGGPGRAPVGAAARVSRERRPALPAAARLGTADRARRAAAAAASLLRGAVVRLVQRAVDDAGLPARRPALRLQRGHHRPVRPRRGRGRAHRHGWPAASTTGAGRGP